MWTQIAAGIVVLLLAFVFVRLSLALYVAWARKIYLQIGVKLPGCIHRGRTWVWVCPHCGTIHPFQFPEEVPEDLPAIDGETPPESE